MSIIEGLEFWVNIGNFECWKVGRMERRVEYWKNGNMER